MTRKEKKCFDCPNTTFFYKRIEGKIYCTKCSSKYKKTKPLKKRSEKKIEKDKEYSSLSKQFIADNPICQVSLPSCTTNATDIHHTHYRGEYYLDQSTWKAVCRNCHNWIHANPIDAKKLNLLKSIK